MQTKELADRLLAVPQDVRLEGAPRQLREPIFVQGPHQEAKLTRANLAKQGFELTDSTTTAGVVISLEIAPNTPWRKGSHRPDEAYRLEIRALNEQQTAFRLAGGSKRAVDYGIKLVESLLDKGETKTGVFEDWPSYYLRGIIEGFYGPPWRHEQRVDLFSFFREHRFNTYVYAPKADPYHRERWREPYPNKELQRLEREIGCCSDQDVSWAFALSPGLSFRYSSQEDLQKLIAKLHSIYNLGGRIFGLFFDDVPDYLVHPEDQQQFATLAEAQNSLIHDLYSLFQSKDSNVHFLVCPTVYCGVGDSDYLSHLGHHLPAGVDVFWTGPSICSAQICGSSAEKVAAVLGRRPLLWDNYPVNDGIMASELHLGPYTGRGNDLVKSVRGVFANPMFLPEASKIPLASIAAYAWNARRYRPGVVWSKSIEREAPAHAEAMKRFASCNAISQLDSTPRLLKQQFDQFQSIFWSGDFEGAILRLRAFFEGLKTDLQSLYNLSNQVLIDEIRPWLEDTIFWCRVGIGACDCYQVAVERFVSHGQHATAQLIARPETEHKHFASTGQPLDSGLPNNYGKDVQMLLRDLLKSSVDLKTKACGAIVRNFAQEALLVYRSIDSEMRRTEQLTHDPR